MSIHSYQRVSFLKVYPGTDIQFLTSEDVPYKYNFILHPGADIDDIQIRINGPEKSKQLKDKIQFKTDFGKVDETIPRCFYRTANREVEINGRFYRIAGHLYGFKIDQPLPEGATLCIDPVPTRIWGTYYGGTSMESQDVCCSVSTNGYVYLAGTTRSSDHIATPGSHQFDTTGNYDLFLVKFANCQSPDTASQIYGPDTVCADSQGISFYIDPIPSATGYHWCISGNLVIVSGQNTTNIIVDIDTITGIETISVYGINACDNGFPKSWDILVQSRPVPGITGSDTICTGDTAVFFTEPGMTNHIWIVSPGGTIIAGGSVTDPLISVVWSAGGAQWVSVGYETSGCPSLQPTQKAVWVNAGSNDPFYSYTPVNGDAVQCVLTSNLPCASGNPAVSNPVTMTVEPYLAVAVSITPSANPVCEGDGVTFTAFTTNKGMMPVYQWFVNSTPVGTNDSTYTYIPSAGDQVYCLLTSSELCTANNPATSDTVTMSGNPL